MRVLTSAEGVQFIGGFKAGFRMIKTEVTKRNNLDWDTRSFLLNVSLNTSANEGKEKHKQNRESNARAYLTTWFRKDDFRHVSWLTAL